MSYYEVHTAQVVVNDYTEVAKKTKDLLDTLVITTLYSVAIEKFGTDKWLILVVYD